MVSYQEHYAYLLYNNKAYMAFHHLEKPNKHCFFMFEEALIQGLTLYPTCLNID